MIERFTKEKSCDGKTRYNTIREANQQVRLLNKRKGKVKNMSSYKCQFCGGYHYGHNQHRRMKHLRKPTYLPEWNPDDVRKQNNNAGGTGEYLNIKNNNL